MVKGGNKHKIMYISGIFRQFGVCENDKEKCLRILATSREE